MSKLDTCELCKKTYPYHLVNNLTIVASAGTIIKLACPICALYELNQAKNLPINRPFDGEEARQYYAEAIKFDNERN